jgi:hypothetical protein
LSRAMRAVTAAGGGGICFIGIALGLRAAYVIV